MIELHKTEIPEEKHAAVHRALEASFGDLPIEDMTLLAGGRSTALVYKLTVGGKQYVLRIMIHTDPLRDPLRAFSCMRMAADAGVAPKVWYANAEDGVSVTDYIESAPYAHEYRNSDDFPAAIASVIARIHSLPPFPTLINFMDGVDIIIKNFKAFPALSEEEIKDIFQLYCEVAEWYPRNDPDKVASHNDLNPGNIIYDGIKIWIIDWESAFENDRYTDLAIAINFFAETPQREESLLREYFGASLDDIKRARIFLMRQSCLIYHAIMLLQFASQDSSKGMLMLRKAKMHMQSQRFKESLALMKDAKSKLYFL